MVRKLILLGLVVILAGCQTGNSPTTSEAPSSLPLTVTQTSLTYLPEVSDRDAEASVQASPTITLPDPTATSAAEATDEPAEPTPTSQPAQAPAALGPDTFPQGYNPLTGLPVEDPSLLAFPPALISVSNFPVTARPQAGLSFSPYVYEMYIGHGMTRFLAMFYGDFPHAEDAAQGGSPGSQLYQIGPIRSGRLPYEHVRNLYSGFLVMASASSEVGMTINESTNIFGSDSDDINSAMIDVTRLEEIASNRAASSRPFNLTGNLFDPAVPAGGEPAERLWVFYNYLNQVQWDYDAASGTYLRSQDQAEVSREFVPATDRLTGEQLAFENVIVLFAQHNVLNSEGSLIDINLLYTEYNAYLFRDGQVFPLRWNTRSGEYEQETGSLRPIRFTDLEGNPFPLKPGSTWVQVVDTSTGFWEFEPGAWKARFYNP